MFHKGGSDCRNPNLCPGWQVRPLPRHPQGQEDLISDGSSPRAKATHTLGHWVLISRPLQRPSWPGQASLGEAGAKAGGRAEDSLSSEASLTAMVKAGAPRDRRGMRDRSMPEDHCTPLGKGSGFRLQWWEMSTCSLSPFKPLLIRNNFTEKAQSRARDQGSACV